LLRTLPIGGEGRKQFFFGKKNQKTFPFCGTAGVAHRAFAMPKRAKVFWFFFSKKN
jgi:hypothetical protein